MSTSRFPALLAALLLLAGPALRADPPASDDVTSLKQELAETQEKLSAALRSFSLLEDEHDKLKDQEAHEAAQLAELKADAPVAAQARALQERVRQLQDEVASLASQNEELKTKLALAGPLPGSPAAPAR